MERVFQLLFLSFCLGFIVLVLSSEPARPKQVKNDNLDAKLNEVLEKLDVVSCAASGYIDNLDGTVCDCERNLMWEKKTGTVGENRSCRTPSDCPDPHDVNNRYTWSSTGQDPDGTAYTVFLAQLNDVAGGCFAGHCDWRLPAVDRDDDTGMPELETILDLSKGDCGGVIIGACINPVFGPTAESFYWSSTTTLAVDPLGAWAVNFNLGNQSFVIGGPKGFNLYARAVRECD